MAEPVVSRGERFTGAPGRNKIANKAACTLYTESGGAGWWGTLAVAPLASACARGRWPWQCWLAPAAAPATPVHIYIYRVYPCTLYRVCRDKPIPCARQTCMGCTMGGLGGCSEASATPACQHEPSNFAWAAAAGLGYFERRRLRRAFTAVRPLPAMYVLQLLRALLYSS